MTDDQQTNSYIATLQGDITKLQIQLFKSEETIRKLQEVNAVNCKVFV